MPFPKLEVQACRVGVPSAVPVGVGVGVGVPDPTGVGVPPPPSVALGGAQARRLEATRTAANAEARLSTIASVRSPAIRKPRAASRQRAVPPIHRNSSGMSVGQLEVTAPIAPVRHEGAVSDTPGGGREEQPSDREERNTVAAG